MVLRELWDGLTGNWTRKLGDRRELITGFTEIRGWSEIAYVFTEIRGSWRGQGWPELN